MDLEAKRRILIVDDEPALRSGLARCCRGWGFEPDVAASAEEALALLDSLPYDYILTDLNMPGIGGQSLLERLAHVSPNTPCIVVTGDPNVGNQLDGLPNVIQRLQKPVAPPLLRKILLEEPLSRPPQIMGADLTRPKALVNVLLVEDSATDAMILELAIQATGFCASTKTARSVREARALLRTHDFDVVVTDLRLPDSDGIRTVRELLSVASTVPLVVVSANDDDSLAEQAIQAGAQDYLVKGQYARAALGRIVRHSVERKKTEKRLLRLAMRDQLTGLVNRVFFRERVASALAGARRSTRPFAVMYVDLDGFKGINDSLGHDAGDALIQQAATRLENAMREEDTVARLGGDEFAILIEDACSAQDVLRIAERCRHQLSLPFELDLQDATISGSMGLAFYPEAGNTVDALLSAADAAMYRAKHQGRDGVCIFSPAIHEQSLERYRMEQRLKSAITRDEFRLVYQPQVATDGSVAGAEALLRWQMNHETPVSPAVFIPILEESGQIREVGSWVLQEACRQFAQFKAEGTPLPRISVNVSSRQLEQVGFVDKVREVVELHHMEPDELELELTEATLVKDPKRAELVLSELRNMGVRLALDDFGTGFSSLNYLDRFPVDTLKVDRSFVTRMVESPRTQVLAEAIFTIGRRLGLELVAEGVETHEQLRTVYSKGAQLIQGYLTGRPCTPEDLQIRLQSEAKAARELDETPELAEQVTLPRRVAQNENGCRQSGTVAEGAEEVA